MIVIKRSGQEIDWNPNKIVVAISKANNTVLESERIPENTIVKIAYDIESECMDLNRPITVEEIQDMVEKRLMDIGAKTVAKNYIIYRYERALRRKENNIDGSIETLIGGINQELLEENSNKNPTILSVQRDYIAGEYSKDYSRRKLIPEDIIKAHDMGLIHQHDMDYYIQKCHNCDLINLDDMLQNGSVISGVMIDKPKSFSTACNVATQIIAQVASSQLGGQSITLSDLAPFVEVSRQKIKNKLKEDCEKVGLVLTKEQFDTIVKSRLRDEINKGVQTIQYQVVTLMTTNGQAPFITVFMYLNEVEDEQTKEDLALIIEEMLKQRILGVKNEAGVYVTPAFPKLIYVLEEDNIHEDSKYYYLTKLAAKCSAKRMVPDLISEKIMKQLKINKFGHGNCYSVMGCRSALTPDRIKGNISKCLNYDPNKGKYYGRFNLGVVTINLVDVACSSNKDEDLFWKIFDERLELCHKALLNRVNYLKGTPSDIAPILWQHGALARLEKGETIDKLFYGGYATISLGYAGLYECTLYMKGVSHTDEEVGIPFALKVMQHMNDKCAEWKEESNIDFSLYGTPMESTTYKFSKCLQKRFGIIEGVTDHNYITNSYHVNVREDIDAFDKLKFEAKFQKLSPGGAISYVEVPNMQNNVEAVLDIYKFIYDNIMYAEINTKSDYCMECGYDGEILIKEQDGKLIWKCPNCGNIDQSKMSVARRSCGYIGSNFWNQGRTQEIRDRVLHVSKNMFGDKTLRRDDAE